MAERPRLILASQSRSRREMLERAGLTFEVQVSGVDERALQSAFDAESVLHEDYPLELAETLACAKACAVSLEQPDALVIGADQVLALASEKSFEAGGRTLRATHYEILEKPADLAAARTHLMRLRGRGHQLHAAVALAHNGDAVWSFTDSAELTMRNFSDAFLTRYLEAAGPRVCQSVGAYELEGLGVQLFEDVHGDFFTILGMPLVPLLEELRERGAIDS